LRIQFKGILHSVQEPVKKRATTPIWRAKAEPKCKIFAWIILQRKILTTTNLEKRGWPNDPIRKLCNSLPETSDHLCKNCTNTCVVWDHLRNWFDMQLLPLNTSPNSVYGCGGSVDCASTKHKNHILMIWSYIFGGTSGRNVIEEPSNMNARQL
jgi:hypothetical protein